MRLSEDRLPTALWLIDWAHELRQCYWFLQTSKRTRAEICPTAGEKVCRNHCHETCSYIETNNTRLYPTRAYLVSRKHKKSQPVRKRFYQKKRNGIAHFIILWASPQNNSSWQCNGAYRFNVRNYVWNDVVNTLNWKFDFRFMLFTVSFID